MRRLLYLLPGLAFAALAIYFARGLGHDPALLPSALIGRPAPEFTLPGLDGGPGLARSDLGGRVVLVNFFASWCAPCRVEHPMLLRLAHEDGLTIYGIDYKDGPAAAARLLAELGDPYRRIGVDPKGLTAIDFGVYGVPETYVVDREGRIRYREVGPLSVADYEGRIRPLLKQLGGP